jgi:DNA-binding NtrC family response regulator
MKSNLSILIIEDDKYTRLNLREILHPFGIIEEAVNSRAGIEKIKDYSFDIVLTDLDLGDGSGLEILPITKKKNIHTIVVSSYEHDDMIEQAYLAGASHFLSKIKLRDKLPVYIEKFIQNKNDKLDKFLSEEFITQDSETIQDLKKLCQINLKGQNLFISGPTGTGKSLLGKLIHELNNSKGPLVHLNCSEVAENLLESELFGHEKGAFTGADQKKDGKLKMAHGGTLFLDEVATMPMSMQQKLLKALDEKTFYPVGSITPVKCEFTLISATCEDIKEKIGNKQFREDLYYRLSGFHFRLKPLNERINDLDMLLRHFQKKSHRRFVIKPDAIDSLKAYSWPGNIREFLRTCELFSQEESGIIHGSLVNQLLTPSSASVNSVVELLNLVQTEGLNVIIDRIEKSAVEDSLKRNNGKITACIKELKISSSAFYRILQKNKLRF